MNTVRSRREPGLLEKPPCVLRIRFDQATPVPLRQVLTGHSVDEDYLEISLSGEKNLP